MSEKCKRANDGRVTYKEGHAYCVEHEDEQELEEICRMWREAGHPVRTEYTHAYQHPC